MKKLGRFFLKALVILFVLTNTIVAFHAYKFTHFYNADEKPIKQLTGLGVTKQILLGINAYKQVTAQPDSNYQKVILTTASKIKLEGWYIPANSSIGTVIMLHGHGGTKSGNEIEAAAFRQMGYNTFQIDFRAHGNSGGNTCTIGFDESEDVKLAYNFIKEKEEKNIVLWGISMGAATITKAISDFELKPQKVILEMPFGSIVDAAEGRIKMMHLPPEPLATLLTFWGGVLHGFWAFNMSPIEFSKKINCPVLLQWGKNDNRVSQSEIDTIFENITAPKKLVVYDKSGHESLCGNEFEKWMIAVSEFLQVNISK